MRWKVNGVLIPADDKEGVVKAILRVHGFDYAEPECAHGMLNVWCYTVSSPGDDFMGDFSDEIAEFVKDGELYAVVEEYEDHFKYKFHDGEYSSSYGEKYIYFTGEEDKFVDNLPKEIIKAVLEKYA